MTLYEFNRLNCKEKYQATWDLGVHLDTLVNHSNRVNLYALDKFFVEVYYDPLKNRIYDIKAFKSGDKLDRYSGDINLSGG